MNGDGYITVFGYGSLLSKVSALCTMPNLKHHRPGKLFGWKRVFSLVSVSNIKNGWCSLCATDSGPKDIAAVAVRETSDTENPIIGALFEIHESEICKYKEREHRYEFRVVNVLDCGDTEPSVATLKNCKSIKALLCIESSDSAYISKCGSNEEYHKRVGQYYTSKCNDSSQHPPLWGRRDIVPTVPYLRLCLASAMELGGTFVQSNFLDTSFLVDGSTSIRAYLCSDIEASERAANLSHRHTWPTFDSCFNDKHRKIRYGLWSLDDSTWMSCIKREYKNYMASRKQFCASNIGKKNVSNIGKKNVNVSKKFLEIPTEWTCCCPKTWKCATRTYCKDCRCFMRETSWRIPRIIHHIWLGSKFPPKLAAFRKKWISMHPGWRCMLWTDKEAENFNLCNRKQYNRVLNFGAKSDILRYEILYKFGGVYVDCDMECIKPVDHLHATFDFYCGMSNTGTIEINNAIIGSRPQHHIIRDCINRISRPPEMTFQYGSSMRKQKLAIDAMSVASSYNKDLSAIFRSVVAPITVKEENISGRKDKTSSTTIIKSNLSDNLETPMHTICFTGPGMFTRSVMNFQCGKYVKHETTKNNSNHEDISTLMYDKTICEEGNVIILPPTFFYPMPNNASNSEKNIENWLHSESYTLHHWAQTWNTTTLELQEKRSEWLCEMK